ncbi:Lrp/AsnC family transcriptional regulator [Salinadaptatus halalkaliphilus]|uniref:Lrp/AsnC family transcriptional regulator n=1 Tax=Salinadaptatus halalkaliphilus TaxID=2419781 RepID=A0A4S3TRN8_9EURY|nr:Lrp/AsnC family transcriptional regulator [Salinadaptatus halalkaliphilus]THE66330.1 Lrp/AsnC family transcriptional regulator [Salinadaptatus halalkaliphilus]
MVSQVTDGVDEIDRAILKVLAQDPRTPYADIADRLVDEGYELSAEGVRNRVSKLLQKTSPFFLLEPEEHDWEILRLAVSVADASGARDDVMERIADMPFWLVCKGIGTYDVYAVATAASNADVDALVQQVKTMETVTNVEFSIETGRDTNVDDYLSPKSIEEET